MKVLQHKVKYELMVNFIKEKKHETCEIPIPIDLRILAEKAMSVTLCSKLILIIRSFSYLSTFSTNLVIQRFQ